MPEITCAALVCDGLVLIRHKDVTGSLNLGLELWLTPTICGA